MYHIPFPIPSYSYEDALAALRATKRFGIQPLLESVEDMNAELGNPDDHFESAQIAGTNGKTSTARYAAALLGGEGLSVGLYTSPELVSYTERMEVQGSPVDERAFARGIAAAVVAGERVNARRTAEGKRPYDITEFDLLTVGALVVFAERDIDVAVLECGMGGRWDATSATHNIRATAITGIGLDHTRILGDTLEAIAGEKAAIIRAGRSCVLGVGTAVPDSVEDVFLSRCAQQGVTPTLLRPTRAEDAMGEMGRGLPRVHANLPQASYAIDQLPGRIGGSLILSVATPRARYQELAALKPYYQAANIACALCLAEDCLGRPLSAGRAWDSIVTCPTPGRFDVVQPDPVVLVDACHNPQSVQTFLEAIRQVEPSVKKRPPLLCAVLADKDVRGIVELLASEFSQVYVAQTSSPRALSATELAGVFADCGNAPRGAFCSVGEAVEALRRWGFVACGSITTAGEVGALLRRHSG